MRSQIVGSDFSTLQYKQIANDGRHPACAHTMHDDYKTSKEAFVSGTTGSTVLHINAICSVALSSIALHSALTSRVAVFRSTPFFVEWILLSVPLLLSMTVYAEAPGALSVLMLVATAVLLLLPPIEDGAPLPTRVDDGTASACDVGDRSVFQASLPPLRALSTYRAHMMLMTVLSILAVDFQVFPRALAKCETYGVSLMDLGVGSFVFSQGIVSAIPLLKDPSHLRKPFGYKLLNTLKKVASVAILGLIRLLAVKGTDYPLNIGTRDGVRRTLELLRDALSATPTRGLHTSRDFPHACCTTRALDWSCTAMPLVICRPWRYLVQCATKQCHLRK